MYCLVEEGWEEEENLFGFYEEFELQENFQDLGDGDGKHEEMWLHNQ